ncbi:hypothetical protein [Rhodanobacter lindaniclasticus]
MKILIQCASAASFIAMLVLPGAVASQDHATQALSAKSNRRSLTECTIVDLNGAKVLCCNNICQAM